MREVSTSETETGARDDRVVVCRAGRLLCALPLTLVVETMRPLPVRALANTPAYVRGLSLVRGEPIPVVDACLLLGQHEAPPPTRLLTLRVGPRLISLAVTAVLGVEALSVEARRELPSLMSHEDGHVAAAGARDHDLLVVLEAARLLPDALWTEIEARR